MKYTIVLGWCFSFHGYVAYDFQKKVRMTGPQTAIGEWYIGGPNQHTNNVSHVTNTNTEINQTMGRRNLAFLTKTS